jgi:predicted ATPase/class 3 adenylate cyclase
MVFLFTDVEGSTQLWERHPGTMSAALSLHDQVLRESIEEAGGRVFSTAGDSFAAAFPSAEYALSAAVEGQRALRGLEVEGEPLRVRMAVHLGPAERRGGDFFGPTLNRCARLMAAGHGGQILISSAVAESHPTPVAGASLLDLGEHRLKDLSLPERIYQLVHPDLALEFSALRTLEAYRTNLPTFETSFVGRERETADLLAAVDQHRLVTLTGAGGSGKTRLAAQVASELLDRFPEGLWFVDLLGTNQPLGVAGCFLSAVGPAHGAIDDELGAVEEALCERRALLVVDNCEHVVDEAARVINRLLARCPHLRIFATSRQPLGVAGEQVRPVPPLAVPAEDEMVGGLALVREAPAIQLLAERARGVEPSFRVDATNAKAAVSLCRHLDGIPLAIELAAARLRTMSLEEVATRIDRRFRLLTTPWDRTTVHHQTLRAAIDWSFDLLGSDQAMFFLRVGVFEGTFTVAAAEVACGGLPLDPRDVAGILSDLVDQSLVVRVPAATGSRYRLLETIRAYSRERASVHQSDIEATRQSHAQFYRERVEGIEASLYGHGQADLLVALTDDLPDLRAAVDFWEASDPVAAPTINQRGIAATVGEGTVRGSAGSMERRTTGPGRDPMPGSDCHVRRAEG